MIVIETTTVLSTSMTPTLPTMKMATAFPRQKINSRTILLARSPAIPDSMADIRAKKQMLDIMHHLVPSSNFDVLQAHINRAQAKRVASMQTQDTTFQKKVQPHKNRVQSVNIKHHTPNHLAMMQTQDIS
tara:strand:+ start:455 stop:844 length:390 start_codon:yes stop_codon:yes gene_type:complete